MRLHPLHNQRGITIFETLIAAVMTGILMAAALPSLSTSLNAHSLKASLRSTSNYVRLTRSVAVSRNADTRLVVSEGGTRLAIEVDEAGTWSAVGTPLVLEGGVRVENVSPSSTLSFSPQGTASAATTLTLAAGGESAAIVTVSLLGNVKAS